MLKDKQYFLFLLVSGFIFSVLIISGNYTHMPVSNLRDIILVFSHWIIVSFAYFILVYILSLNKWIFLFFLPLVNLISAIGSYYVYQYDISINPAIIESVFNTNSDEISSLVTLPFIIYILLVFFLSVYFAVYRLKKIKINNYLIHIIFILIGIFVCQTIDKKRYKTISHRVPFSFYDATKEYIKTKKLIEVHKIDVSDGSIIKTDTLTVLLVIGESARADHLSLNGYARNTCPELETKDVISFRKIYSPWTHTNKSLPYILTRASENNLTPMYEETSLISVFNRCGFKTSWIGNQNPGDTYMPFVNNCDSVIINKSYQTVYSYSKKLDEELLPHIQGILKESGNLKFIIIHLMGSHWFYNSHYPERFEIFKPVMKGKTISKDDSTKMINSYDNTILYTDYILSQLIEKVNDQKALMLYVSDHGELLGEDNKWLHANGTKYEKNPAFIIWFSPKYISTNIKLKIAADKNKNKRFGTETVFHSLLESALITNEYIDTTRTIFHN